MERHTASDNVVILTPRTLVKKVKSTLEHRQILDRTTKIKSASSDDGFKIITTLAHDVELVRKSLELLGENTLRQLEIRTVIRSHNSGPGLSTTPVSVAVHTWLKSVYPEETGEDQAKITDLMYEYPKGYSIYPPMLLLPANIFSGPLWSSLLQNTANDDQQQLYRLIARAMSVTHIAINAPIPPSITPDSSSQTHDNILRSPKHLQPLYGDFGPDTSRSPATTADFKAAFWASTRQNGITQIWAPRYTMFSRGNIREKTRILELPSVSSLRGIYTAVDLYAGIGYFTFSYAKAGADLVLGFEMNEWSVEGLVRGASVNRWGVEVYKQPDLQNVHDILIRRKPKIAVFEMDNVNAAVVVPQLVGRMMPIRHVNLGLLPTSRNSWELAVGLVDEVLGGWIHVHENYREDELDNLIEDAMKSIGHHHARRFGLDVGKPRLDYVERVKTYAPGVVHYVLDIHLPGSNTKKLP